MRMRISGLGISPGEVLNPGQDLHAIRANLRANAHYGNVELCHHISVFLVTEAGWGSRSHYRLYPIKYVRTWAMWFCDVAITRAMRHAPPS